jgi:hypothetical protein
MKMMPMCAAVGLLALAAASPAAAATYVFSFTGDATASWTLPRAPAPNAPSASGFGFEPFTLMLNGDMVTGLLAFYSDSFDGGFAFGNDLTPLINGSGETLWTGSPTAPVFKTGSFQLTAFIPGIPGNGTLTIAAVPEPASWAMLIAGFGLTGAVMRRRKAALSA